MSLKAAGLIAEDLLCGSSEAVSSRLLLADGQKRANVVLRIEVATSADTKVATGVLYGFTVLCYTGLVVEIILKATIQDSLSVFRTVAVEATSVAVASVCFCFLGVRLVVYVQHVLQTRQAKQRWKPRRKRMSCLAFIGASIQMFNILNWLLPNAYILVKYPGCSFFDDLIQVCGCLRWTCWNSSLLIYLVLGSSLLAWTPGSGMLARLRSSRKAGSPVPQFLLGMDAPWWHHLNKFPIWLVFEAAIVITVSPWTKDYTINGIPLPINSSLYTAAKPPQNCFRWSDQYTCWTDEWVLIGTILLMLCVGLYFFLYLICMARVHLQLSRQPYTVFRAANILYQLQLRTVLMTFKVLTVSTAFLWFFHRGSCLSYFFTWLGMLPMQLIATALAFENLYLFMPKNPEHDPALQVWLQEVAWTEADLPKQLEERNSRAHGPSEAASLAREPMFCYETALKLLKWSSLTYSSFGQGSRSGSGKQMSRASSDGSGLVKGSLHASGDWPSTPYTDSMERDSSMSRRSMDSASIPEEAESDAELDPTTFDMHSVGDAGSTSDATMPEVVVVANALKPRARPKETAEQLLAAAMALWGLTDIESFWCPQLDVKAVLGWNQDQVVLAFRGTASFANALSDLKVWQTMHHSETPRQLLRRPPLVHTGFYRAWVSTGLNQQVLGLLRGLFDAGLISKAARVCVTGHSLGGALAVLAAHDIAAQLKSISLQVVTFGCPYIGNHAFAADYEACVPDTWHIIHDRDPVPRAGKFWVLFKRPGNRVIVNIKGEMIVRPSALELQVHYGSKLKHHLLRAYRRALVSVLLAQFSHRGSPSSMMRALSLSSHAALRDDLAKDGVDWQRLRRVARWGSVAAQKLLPPKACVMRAFRKSTDSPHRGWSRPQDTTLQLAALEEARAMIQAEEGQAMHSLT